MKKLICHCGAVEAEINLDGDLAKVIKCNCSICKRKGAIMSMVKNEDFKIVGKTHNLPFGKIKLFDSLFFLISHYLWAKKTVIDLLESQDEPDVYFTRSDWVFYLL